MGGVVWLRQIVLGGGGDLVSLTMDDICSTFSGPIGRNVPEPNVEGEIGGNAPRRR